MDVVKLIAEEEFNAWAVLKSGCRYQQSNLFRHCRSAKDTQEYFNKFEQDVCLLSFPRTKPNYFINRNKPPTVDSSYSKSSEHTWGDLEQTQKQKTRTKIPQGISSSSESTVGSIRSSSPNLSHGLLSKDFEVYKLAYNCCSYPIFCKHIDLSKGQGKSKHTKKHISVRKTDTDKEVLLQYLGKVFNLTNQNKEQYQFFLGKKEFDTALQRKVSKKRILQRELFSKLQQLERDEDKYYKHEAFQRPHHYKLWKNSERLNIGDLLDQIESDHLQQKPFFRNSYQDFIHLANKVFLYELSEIKEGQTFSKLAIRLLLEFSHRYRLTSTTTSVSITKVILDICDDNNENWLDDRTIACLLNNFQLLQNNKNLDEQILKSEGCDLIEASGIILKVMEEHVQSCFTKLSQLSTSSFVNRLKLAEICFIIHTRATLQNTTWNEWVDKWMRESIKEYYISITKKQSELSTLSLLETVSLIIDAIKSSNNPKSIVQIIFAEWIPDLIRTVTNTLYHLVMDDLYVLSRKKEWFLSDSEKSNSTLQNISIALAYRLNDLDILVRMICGTAITTEHVSWRITFHDLVMYWLDVLSCELTEKILKAIAEDDFIPVSTTNTFYKSVDISFDTTDRSSYATNFESFDLAQRWSHNNVINGNLVMESSLSFGRINCSINSNTPSSGSSTLKESESDTEDNTPKLTSYRELTEFEKHEIRSDCESVVFVTPKTTPEEYISAQSEWASMEWSDITSSGTIELVEYQLSDSEHDIGLLNNEENMEFMTNTFKSVSSSVLGCFVILFRMENFTKQIRSILFESSAIDNPTEARLLEELSKRFTSKVHAIYSNIIQLYCINVVSEELCKSTEKTRKHLVDIMLLKKIYSSHMNGALNENHKHDKNDIFENDLSHKNNFGDNDYSQEDMTDPTMCNHPDFVGNYIYTYTRNFLNLSIESYIHLVAYDQGQCILALLDKFNKIIYSGKKVNQERLSGEIHGTFTDLLDGISDWILKDSLKETKSLFKQIWKYFTQWLNTTVRNLLYGLDMRAISLKTYSKNLLYITGKIMKIWSNHSTVKSCLSNENLFTPMENSLRVLEMLCLPSSFLINFHKNYEEFVNTMDDLVFGNFRCDASNDLKKFANMCLIKLRHVKQFSGKELYEIVRNIMEPKWECSQETLDTSTIDLCQQLLDENLIKFMSKTIHNIRLPDLVAETEQSGPKPTHSDSGNSEPMSNTSEERSSEDISFSDESDHGVRCFHPKTNYFYMFETAVKLTNSNLLEMCGVTEVLSKSMIASILRNRTDKDNLAQEYINNLMPIDTCCPQLFLKS